MDFRFVSLFIKNTSEGSLFEKEPIKPIEPTLNSKPVQVISLPVASEDDEEFYDVDEFEEEEFYDCEEIEEGPVATPNLDDTAFETGFFGFAARVGNAALDVMESDSFLKLSAFSNSIVGNKVIQAGKSMVCENIGMLIGAALPEQTISFAAGKAAANALVPDHPNVAIGVGLTVAALSTSLNYLTGGETGPALQMMVTAAGTIAGGMTGLEAGGIAVPENYIPRTAAYLATAGATNGVVGTLAYFGPEVAAVTDKIMNAKPNPDIVNMFDPGNFAQNVVNNAYGSADAAADMMAHKLTDSPLFSGLVQMLLKHSVEKNVATNAITRAMNDYFEFIQDAGIQKMLEEFKAVPDEISKALIQEEIAKGMKKKYTALEKQVAGQIQLKSDATAAYLAGYLADMTQKNEKELFGMDLSTKEQNKELLEILIPALIPHIGVYYKREVTEPQALTPEEVEQFYKNVSAVMFAPYSGTMIGTGMYGLVSTLIPVLQNKGQFIAKMLSEQIGQSLVDPIISIDDDPEFAIERINAPAQKPIKKGFWASLREKIENAVYLINTIGFKQFSKGFFSHFFAPKKPKEK